MNEFNIYSDFIIDNKINFIPFIEIKISNEDKYITWNKEIHRLDILSNDYYGNSNYQLLIMLCNTKYGNDEFDYNDGDIIRIPYPFNSAVSRYIESVQKYKQIYQS